jgi:hypothetical protein
MNQNERSTTVERGPSYNLTLLYDRLITQVHANIWVCLFGSASSSEAGGKRRLDFERMQWQERPVFQLRFES